MITFQYRLNIKSCTTTQYRQSPPLQNILISIIEVLLIFKEVIFRSRLTDINQMIRYQLTINRIVSQIFSCTNIHAPVHLPAIRTDNLSTLGITTPRSSLQAVNLGCKGGSVRIGHCQNEALALALCDDIRRRFPGADVKCYPLRGLCSYYAERGGIMLGFES